METKKVIERESWKEKMSKMSEGQEISVSIRFRDNNFGLAERITKLTKQGYFKYCGMKHGTMTWKRTNKSAENYGKESNWDYYGKRKFDLQGLIEDEKIRILKENGWYQYYSETHFVHEKICSFFEKLGIMYFGKEHTNYQHTLEEAWNIYKAIDNN